MLNINLWNIIGCVCSFITFLVSGDISWFVRDYLITLNTKEV